MSRFREYLKTLVAEIEALSKEEFQDALHTAVEDGKTFLEKTKADLERWSRLLAKGELTKEDFQWLVTGKKDLAELEGLKQKGYALARLEEFRSSLVDTVVRTAFDVFL